MGEEKKAMSATFRWLVTITYQNEIPSGDGSNLGMTEVDHAIMELSELHNIIERGPSFQTIDSIVIKYVALPLISIEEAARQ